MLKNYFLVTLRNLVRNFNHTSINVLGLTLGISGAILIFVVLTYLVGFDSYHRKADRIFRVVTQSKESTGTFETPGVPVPLNEAVINYFPEVERGTFVSYERMGLVTVDNGKGKVENFPEENGVVFLDSNFYRIFDRVWIKGNPKAAFKETNTVILSMRVAKKYFGTVEVIGKHLRFNNKYDLNVVGLVEDFPETTHFPFDLMISYETIRNEKNKGNGWNSIWSDEQCYVLLHEGSKAETLNLKFPAFIDKHYPRKGPHPTTSENKSHWLQPLKELHFDPRFSNYTYDTTSINSLLALGVLAIFLILTASINFINLTTAIAVNRSREVGVRKVLGSSKIQLVSLFFGETFLITLIAVLISIGLAEVALEQLLNPFLKLNLGLGLTENSLLILFLIGVLLVVSFLSGLYPSLIISGFKPVHALKNTVASGNFRGFALRKVLVVFQFVVTQLLITCTIVILWQTRYMKNFDMGFSRDAIVLVDLPVRNITKMEGLVTSLSTHSSIKRVSASANAPASGNVFGTSANFVGESEVYGVQFKMIDPNYLDLYKINLLSGKNIIREDTARRVLVNETFVKHVGVQKYEDILGREIMLNGEKVAIEGVVSDFHTVSLQSKIEPVALGYYPTRFNLVGFEINLRDWEEVRKFVEKNWKNQFPEYTINLRFMDKDIEAFYSSEERMGTMVVSFCCIAIFIGCIGLYGLVIFMSKMKMKEVGIRKTFGASVISIVNMFSWEFIKLIFIAFMVSSPFAWWIMSRWLNNYSYHIDVGWQVFFIGLMVTVIIALTTVAHRSIKSALANPVDSLKAE